MTIYLQLYWEFFKTGLFCHWRWHGYPALFEGHRRLYRMVYL